MKIYDAAQFDLCLIGGGQEVGNLSEHFGIRCMGIIKARRIDQVNGAVNLVMELIYVGELGLFGKMTKLVFPSHYCMTIVSLSSPDWSPWPTTGTAPESSPINFEMRVLLPAPVTPMTAIMISPSLCDTVFSLYFTISKDFMQNLLELLGCVCMGRGCAPERFIVAIHRVNRLGRAANRMNLYLIDDGIVFEILRRPGFDGRDVANAARYSCLYQLISLRLLRLWDAKAFSSPKLLQECAYR